MQATTNTDPISSREWSIDDEVIQLRVWGTERAHPLPRARTGEWVIGSAPECTIRVTDEHRFISRQHARLVRDERGLRLQDAGSTNGLWLDDARRLAFALVPGIEIGMGALKLIAESERLIALRAFLARLLGFHSTRQLDIDRALRALRTLAMLRTPLTLYGDGDLVDVARQLHARAFGCDRFVVCDPRRRRFEATARSARSCSTASDAIERARGGTVCVWTNRLPDDFDDLRVHFGDRDVRIRLILCARDGEQRPACTGNSIRIPALSERADELERIIDEYAAEAIATLAAKPSSFGSYERDWLRKQRPRSITEIPRAVERLVAIRDGGSLTAAAERLGISHAALSRWFHRRR